MLVKYYNLARLQVVGTLGLSCFLCAVILVHHDSTIPMVHPWDEGYILIFTHNYHKFMPNVGRYSIGGYGIGFTTY